MRRLLATFTTVLVLATAPVLVHSETIEVLIKGVDDGIKTSKQHDYNEALMNAKLQAIERAGVEISSITRVVNFQTKFDMVESKAKAILLPGFQVMDIGYQGDGTYQVVLAGKVQVGKDEAGEEGTMRVVFNGIDIFETYNIGRFEKKSIDVVIFLGKKCGCMLRTLSPVEFYLKKVGNIKGQLIESIDYGRLGDGGTEEFYTDCDDSGYTMFESRFNFRCKTDPFRERIKRNIEIPIVTNTKYVLWVYTPNFDLRRGVKLVSRPFVFEVKSPITSGKLIIPLAKITYIDLGGESPFHMWRINDDSNIDTEVIAVEELRETFNGNINYQPKTVFYRIKTSGGFDPSMMYSDI